MAARVHLLALVLLFATAAVASRAHVSMYYNYPGVGAVFEDNGVVCAGLVLGLSGQIGNPSCTGGSDDAIAQGSSMVNQPLVFFNGGLDAWVFLSNGSLVYFNMTLPQIPPTIWNHVVPSHLELLAVSSLFANSYALALDTNSGKTGVYILTNLYPGGTPKLSLALALPFADVSSSVASSLVMDLNAGQAWAFAGPNVAILNLTFSSLELADSFAIPYQFIRGVSTAFMFQCLRGVIVEDGVLSAVTLDLTSLAVVSRESFLPAAATLSSFMDYSYWPDTWIDAVAYSLSGTAAIETTYGTTLGWGGQSPYQAIGWVVISEVTP